MKISFKQWITQESSKAIGSNGENSHPTQSAQAATKVAQGWLGKSSNANDVAKITSSSSPSVLNNKIMKVAADATEKAPNTLAGQTDAVQVAKVMSNSLGLKNTNFNPKFAKKK